MINWNESSVCILSAILSTVSGVELLISFDSSLAISYIDVIRFTFYSTVFLSITIIFMVQMVGEVYFISVVHFLNL